MPPRRILHERRSEREIAANIENLDIHLTTRLELRAIDMAEIPNSIGNLINLTYLELGHNNISVIPDFIGNNLTNLTELKLHYNEITNIPDSIGNLRNLTHLILTHNKISIIPDSIGNLRNLTHLELGSNQITIIPVSIGNLRNLTQLELDRNRNDEGMSITNIGPIVNLRNLKYLKLEVLQISNLPDSIGNLINLERVFLNSNQLNSLPESIGNLIHLESFFLDRNQLTSLPESIGNLTSLGNLSLSSNQLTSLPDSIRNLRNLYLIQLDGNNIVNPPSRDNPFIVNPPPPPPPPPPPVIRPPPPPVIRPPTPVNVAMEIHKKMAEFNHMGIDDFKSLLQEKYNFTVPVNLTNEEIKTFFFDSFTELYKIATNQASVIPYKYVIQITKTRKEFKEVDKEKIVKVINLFHKTDGIHLSVFGPNDVWFAYFSLQYVLKQPIEFQITYAVKLLKDSAIAYEGNNISCSKGVLERILLSLQLPLLIFESEKPEEYSKVLSFFKNIKLIIKDSFLDWVKSEGKQKIKRDKSQNPILDESQNPILIENNTRSEFLKSYTPGENIKEKLIESFTNYLKKNVKEIIDFNNRNTHTIIKKVYEDFDQDGLLDGNDGFTYYSGGRKTKKRKSKKRKSNKKKTKKRKTNKKKSKKRK